MNEQEKRTDLEAYAGHFVDEKKLLQSASGGLATAMSEKIIRKGGCVFGVTYADDFRSAHYTCVERLSDLGRLKGSKYIQADKSWKTGGGGTLYPSVNDKLLAGRTVLVIGLPCEIAAVRAYMAAKHTDTSALYLCDLICHGVTSPKVAEEYVMALEKKYRSKVVDFSVRYKKEGWTPPYVRAVFQNGKEFTHRFYDTDYGRAFSCFSRPSCYQCKFKGSHHTADLTIGDYWGLKPDSADYNSNGVSIALVRTAKGHELLQELEGFCLNKTDVGFALEHNRMYSESKVYQQKQYERFQRDFRKKGLAYASRRSLSIKGKIIRRLPPKALAIVSRIRGKR